MFSKPHPDLEAEFFTVLSFRAGPEHHWSFRLVSVIKYR